MNMPSELETSRTFFLISGIINIIASLTWGSTSILSGFVTCGIGCLVGVLPILNVISAVLDFIAYNKLNTLNRFGTYGTVQTAAVFEIVTILTGNIFSFIFGIITLNNIGRENVRVFLQEKAIY